MNLGVGLGLIEMRGGYPSLHWNSLSDIAGQMSAYYFDAAGAIGHFAYNGDGTWRLISNMEEEPFSPLDLYAMGLIPPDQVPPIHILQAPNLTNLERITAASYRTVTIDQIISAEGGVRIPSAADSQKDFNLAFIVTQDTAYTDAAYAFFSLMAYGLMNQDPPDRHTNVGSFYWATGGRATLNTRLPVDVPDPAVLPDSALPTPTATVDPLQAGTRAAETKQASLSQEAETVQPQNYSSAEASTPAATAGPAVKTSPISPICNCPLLVGGLTILPGALWAWRRKRTRP
jgi:hypothetical protein